MSKTDKYEVEYLYSFGIGIGLHYINEEGQKGVLITLPFLVILITK